MRKRLFLASCIGAIILSGCSGGGGGDSSGGSGSGDKLGRTTGTGLRLVHAGLDESPLTVAVDGKVLVSGGYGEETFYKGLSAGTHAISVTRKNSTETVLQTDRAFDNDTEYSLVVSGEARRDTQRFTFIADRSAKLDAAVGEVVLINALGGRDGAKVVCEDQQTEFVTLGARSAALELPVGAHSCQIISDNGVTLASPTVNVEAKVETTLVLSGSDALGVRFVKTYRDID